MSDLNHITPVHGCGNLTGNMPEPLLPDFEALVSRPDETLDIARIALALARDEDPGLDAGPYLAWLDATAEAIEDAADLAMPISERLAMLDRQLFEIQGFRGNGDDYFDPRNSYLNDVIDRRLGIPITLSVIYLEVGWRLGLPLVPVSFPAPLMNTSSMDFPANIRCEVSMPLSMKPMVTPSPAPAPLSRWTWA